MTDGYNPGDPGLLVNILAPKAGRPISDDPASASIRIRCRPIVKEQIRQLAADAGMSMSEYLLSRAGLS